MSNETVQEAVQRLDDLIWDVNRANIPPPSKAELTAIIETCTEALEGDVVLLLKGFDEGVFVRDISKDNESGWALRVLPYVAALGRLVNATKPKE